MEHIVHEGQLDTHAVEPRRTAALDKPRSFFKSLFGQLATRDFWEGLLSMVVRETTYAFIRYLGSSMVHYVEKSADKDSTSVRDIANGGRGGRVPATSPASGFSGGSVPAPQYESRYSSPSAPAGTAGTTTPQFPGFG